MFRQFAWLIDALEGTFANNYVVAVVAAAVAVAQIMFYCPSIILRSNTSPVHHHGVINKIHPAVLLKVNITIYSIIRRVSLFRNTITLFFFQLIQ